MPRDVNGRPVKDYGKPHSEKKEHEEFEKLGHMAHTKAEMKERMEPKVREDDGPEYPYGLRIHLDHESMKKAGMEELPEIGKEIYLRAKAHVSSASSDKRKDGEERRVELQITHMGFETKEKAEKEEKEEKAEKKEEKGKKED